MMASRVVSRKWSRASSCSTAVSYSPIPDGKALLKRVHSQVVTYNVAAGMVVDRSFKLLAMGIATDQPATQRSLNCQCIYGMS